MALSLITPTKRLEPGAAASWKRMQKAGMPWSRLESAHRSAASQQRLYDLWRAGKGNYALPPSKSNHVKGIAVDSHDKQQAWLDKYGERYGWTQAPNERWHFDYSPAKDRELARIKARAAALKRLAELNAARKKLAAIQKILGTTADGIPGPKTGRAWADLNLKATQK